MKIAFPAVEASPESLIDERFGRAARFLVYEAEKDAWEILDNEQNLNAAQGAGIQAAETLARHGVNALIAGHCGPKAFRTLSAAGIEVYTFEGKITEGLKAYQAKALKEVDGPNVEGHW